MQNGPGHKKRDGGEPPVDIVDAFVKIETVASPVAYWFSIALAAVIAVIGAAVVNALRQDGESRALSRSRAWRSAPSRHSCISSGGGGAGSLPVASITSLEKQNSVRKQRSRCVSDGLVD